MKTISIAMATYNGARFIAEQLQSFAEQTLLPDEVIITDDISTDNTLEIIAGFAATARFPIRVIQNETQLGYRGNFMKAAQMCSSDLIAFSDQDDVWLPQKLEKCCAAFESEDVLMVYHGAFVTDPYLKVIDTYSKPSFAKPSDPIIPPRTLDLQFFSPGFTQVFRRKLLAYSQDWSKSANPYECDKPEAHDHWFFFWASCMGTIIYLKEPLVLYRRHETTVTAYRERKPFAKKISDGYSVHNTKLIMALETHAHNRSSFFRSAQSKLTCEAQLLAEAAATDYERIEKHCRKRREMYEHEGICRRLIDLFTLLKEGGYGRQSRWGVGYKLLIKDILCGIVFPYRTNTDNPKVN